MIEWIESNIGTIAVSAVLILVVVYIIFVLIRDRRKGKSSCGGDCSRCKGCR